MYGDGFSFPSRDVDWCSYWYMPPSPRCMVKWSRSTTHHGPRMALVNHAMWVLDLPLFATQSRDEFWDNHRKLNQSEPIGTCLGPRHGTRPIWGRTGFVRATLNVKRVTFCWHPPATLLCFHCQRRENVGSGQPCELQELEGQRSKLGGSVPESMSKGWFPQTAFKFAGAMLWGYPTYQWTDSVIVSEFVWIGQLYFHVFSCECFACCFTRRQLLNIAGGTKLR